MKFPNKIIKYNESIIPKFIIILKHLEKEESSILNLYNNVKNKIQNITEFMDALDCLFALGIIKFDDTSRRLYYVISD